MLLQKQTSFTGTWAVTLDYTPAPKHEAGTAVWWSKWCMAAAIGVRGTEYGRDLVFRYPDEETEQFHVSDNIALVLTE